VGMLLAVCLIIPAKELICPAAVICRSGNRIPATCPPTLGRLGGLPQHGSLLLSAGTRQALTRN
jgi:hypothetical protein